MHDMYELRRDDHSKTPTRPKEGDASEDEWDPCVGVPREPAAEVSEDALRPNLEALRQVLVADEGRIADYAVEVLRTLLKLP